jgi:translation initiation factor 2B subunit (eIF-2B alpha/beta/delta family)
MARMDDPWASVDALAGNRVQGAAELGRRAAEILPSIPFEELADAIETLLRGHPQMAPLWRLASDLLSAMDPASGADWFLYRLETDDATAGLLAPFLPDELLTISYSSTIVEAIRIRRPARVVCMTSDPGGEGQQMAAVLSEYTDASVMKDADALRKVPAQAVLVGADAITPESLVNKVKTKKLAEAARKKSVPSFVVAGETKFVPEELPITELFEAAPLDLFSGVATPMGLITPSEAGRYAESVELHLALRMLAERIAEEPAEDPVS